MPGRCCAIWPTGARCDGLAVVDDPALAAVNLGWLVDLV
jgi:hypothetical protein